MLSQEEAVAMLKDVGAVITDNHVVLTSGKHGSAYIDKDAIYPHTDVTSALCKALVEQAVTEMHRCDATTIVGPERGGIILSQWAAFHLSEMTDNKVMAVYAEKATANKSFTIKPRWLRHVQGKYVLVVEDVLTTGGSVKKVVDMVNSHGGMVQGVIALCNRGGVTAKDLGVPTLHSLVNIAQLSDLKLDTWLPGECPLCEDGVPINTDVGHSKEFLARQKKQVGTL